MGETASRSIRILTARRGGSDFFDGDCAISRPPDPRGLPGQGLRLTVSRINGQIVDRSQQSVRDGRFKIPTKGDKPSFAPNLLFKRRR